MLVRISCRAILALIFCSLFAATGWALGFGPPSVGDTAPINNRDFPAGTEKLANLPTRFSYSVSYPEFGYEFYYAGDTSQFQTTLDAFAAIKAPQLKLFVYDGGMTSVSLIKRPFNWSFTILNAWNLELFPPSLSVHLGDGSPIDWSAIHVPRNVIVQDCRVATSPWAESKGGVVHAKVFDATTSRTIPGAVLEVYRHNQNQQDDTIASGTADAAGDVVVKDIPSGSYWTRLRGKGYATRDVGFYKNYGRTLDGYDRVNLLPTAALKGRVTDPDGHPIAGVIVSAVELVSLDGEHYSERPEQVKTDVAGRFTLDPLPLGRTSLDLYKPDYRFFSSETFPIPGKEVKLIMTGAGIVQGRVVGPDSKPATLRFHVHLTPANPEGWYDVMPSKEGGRFEFTSVPPGEYTINAYIDEDGGLSPNPGTRVSSTKAVTVVAGKTVNVEITYNPGKAPGGK